MAERHFYGDDFTPKPPMPEHDTAAAVRFLKQWCPEGPWVLTSIVPDGKIATQTFTADEWQQAGAWVEDRQGMENIYFHVNPVTRSLLSKASKEDVARLAWLHVDLDPRAGEDFEEERSRALALLQGYKRRPTVIVDSGGGYQGFWRLLPSDKLEVGGRVARAEELEQYNRQIELELGADHCHNIDRIMRLPGTINLPNLRKRKKHRLPALAQVVEWNEGLAYPIEAFTAAPRVQRGQEGDLPQGRPQVAVSGNVPVVDCDALREWAAQNNKTLSDHVLALIATGADPVDPGKYPSRSEALFRTLCELVRAGVPDEMMYAVITGPNEIASSVREKPHWEQYALRQIERAKEEVIDPVLRKFNEKHAVIADIGGKCRIISEVYDPGLRRTRLSRQSFDDFRNRYCHVKVQVGTTEQGAPIYRPAGVWWINHPMRRQYDTLTFAPGQEVEHAYNLWRGFSCDSLPGDKHESFLCHVRDTICSGNPEYYDYVINWLARSVQKPDSPGEVALVLRGKRGTGKGVFAREFGRLWGRHFMQIADSKHLVGNFNAHLHDVVMVFGDEAFFAGDRKHESVLKTLVTEETIVIERKGIDAEASPNYTHLILASNDAWVVPAGLEERRFFCVEVSDEHRQDFPYFRRVHEDMDDGGLENLLYFLMTRDIKDFNVRKVPQTTALMDQKVLSMDAETEWVYEMLWEGRVLKSDESWRDTVPAELLYEEYIKRMDAQRRQYRLNPTAFGRFLQHVMPPEWPKKVREVCEVPWLNPETGYVTQLRKRAYVYYLPKLANLRKYWDDFLGGPFEWPAVVEPQPPLPKSAEQPF